MGQRGYSVEELRAGDPTVVGGRYRVLGRLGAGGMGTVYLGRSPGGRLVAVKCVHRDIAADPEFRRRFAHELAAVRQVGGFHTAQVVDADPDGDPPWLVTAYIPGPSVGEAVAAHGALPESALRVLGAGLAEALEAIHRVGLVHRDLKPSNVLLAEDGPRVIDFGIARTLDGTAITRTQVVIGSPGYMAPEQIEGGEIGPACDVFSLGLVICHAAGCAPFGEASAQVMLYRVVHTEPDLGAVPDSLRPLIAECLVRDPARRPTPAQLVERFAPPPAGEGAPGVRWAWLPAALREATDAGGPGVPSEPGGPGAPGRPGTPPSTPADAVPPPRTPADAVPPPRTPADAVPPPRTPADAVPPPTALDRPTPAQAPTATSHAGPMGVFGPPLPPAPAPYPVVPAPQPRSRRRLLLIVLPLVLVLAAAGVAVPLFVLKGGGKPAACFGAESGKESGKDGGSRLTSVPKDTPHAPALLMPANRSTVEVGQRITLSWEQADARSQVVLSGLGSAHTLYSTWLHATSCTFTPTAAGLYQWQVSTANTDEHGVSSPWSETRYLDVRKKGATTANPVRDTPDAPRSVAPADQAAGKVNETLTFRWTGQSAHSYVSVQLPDGTWKTTEWVDGTTYRYTPPWPGVYVWIVNTAKSTDCSHAECLSAASQQRYLIVK